MGNQKRFSREARKCAVRMVFDLQDQYASQWKAILSIAEKIGCTRETLRNWVRRAEIDAGRRGGLTTEERRRLTGC